MRVPSAAGAGIAGVIVAAVAAAAVLALAADPAPAGDRIRVAYFPNVGHAIPIVGMQRGIFEDRLAGVGVEARVFDSGPQAIESLFAGSVDMAYVGPGPAINGHLNSRDGNLKILAGAASGGASFVAHPGSVGEGGGFSFDGKRIAAPQMGNTQDVSLRHHLSGLGLVPAERGGSVTIHNISNPDIYTLFVKGEIDGAWVAEPWATILELELGGIRLFHEEDLWPGGGFASVLLVVDADYARENPGTVRSWLDAHDSVAAWINGAGAGGDGGGGGGKDAAGRIFNDFLADFLGRGLDREVVATAMSNIEITSDPQEGSVRAFAERADALGYLGRGGYDLSGLFYDADPGPGAAGGPAQ